MELSNSNWVLSNLFTLVGSNLRSKESISILFLLGEETVLTGFSRIRSVSKLAVVKQVLSLLQQVFVFLLECLKFMHSIVTNHLQFLLILLVDFLLNMLPLIL